MLAGYLSTSASGRLARDPFSDPHPPPHKHTLYIQAITSPGALPFVYKLTSSLIVAYFFPTRVSKMFDVFMVCLPLQTNSRGSDTLESCKAFFFIYIYIYLQIKSVFCFFFLTLVQFRVWPLGGDTAQRRELRKPQQNTIFIPYIQYIQRRGSPFQYRPFNS